MQCLTCKSETKNPKFCSRSCSAVATNQTSKKRKLEGICEVCKIPVTSKHKYCAMCRGFARGIQHITTIQEHKSKLSWRNFHVSMREMSRANYAKSNRPMICQCGYSLHVDICHIKSISEFDETTLLSEVNHADNLIALCKNCHWEFDNGYLTLKSGGRGGNRTHNGIKAPAYEAEPDLPNSLVARPKS